MPQPTWLALLEIFVYPRKQALSLLTGTETLKLCIEKYENFDGNQVAVKRRSDNKQ